MSVCFAALVIQVLGDRSGEQEIVVEEIIGKGGKGQVEDKAGMV